MLLQQTLQVFRDKIEVLNSYLLIALLFFIPFSTAIGSILSGIILISWLYEAKFSKLYKQLKDNRVVVASLLFFVLHVVGLFWTEDIEWGLHTVKKEWKFLMLPIFMFYVRKEHIRYYIYAFVLAMSISELISYGIWFEQIPPFKNATISNPTPFMTHITYNPLLAIAIYLIASDVIFHQSHFNYKRVVYFLFLITMTINMFITGGRSGQVMLFVAVVLLSFQYFSGSFIKSTITSAVIGSFVFFLAYSYSSIFSERFDMAIHNTLNYEQNKGSSVGQRLTFAVNGVNIFLENLVLGVGTGDLPNAMQEEHRVNTPEIKAPNNPHNMYVMMAVQFGFAGLAALAWLFYTQIKFALKNNNAFMRRFGVALPILFLVANLGESYFSVHATSLLFCVLSAIVYREYSSNESL